MTRDAHRFDRCGSGSFSERDWRYQKAAVEQYEREQQQQQQSTAAFMQEQQDIAWVIPWSMKLDIGLAWNTRGWEVVVDQMGFTTQRQQPSHITGHVEPIWTYCKIRVLVTTGLILLPTL